ncbi:MAG TPA: ChbG/HpnK family deacetylase [Candidatus Baltobacteraceae bacterium]|nr:ChbG/HpnK family deacetylase [Candidatus Baltobacteraceae bacterium]
MSKRLIVNADDFNLTPGVTRGILDGHRYGIITSTTVMVNLPGLEHSRDLAVDGAPDLGLGLHLNFTLGAPVLPPPAVPSLVDTAGRFHRDRDRLGTAGNPNEIRAEAAAQVVRFRSVFGRPPTHLDTHYHMHRLEPVFAVLLDLAAELQVPVRALSPEMAATIRERGLAAVDRAVGDVAADAYWTADNLIALIETLGSGVTELMCHPGYVDTGLAISSYREQREDELRALCDPELKYALRRAGVALIHYGALQESVNADLPRVGTPETL